MEVVVGAAEPVEEEVVESTEPVEEVIETEEVVNDATEEATEESEGVADESGEATDDNTEVDEIDLSGLKYGDLDIEVDIPTEVDTMLSDKGFNAAELTKELYEGGEISLSQETMDNLYKEFGKFQVDNYLSGLKSAAELLKYSMAEQTAETDKANAKAWDNALEIVGSEEGWSNIEEWLQSPESSDTITDEELVQFNKIMDEGTPYMQKLAIDSLNNRYRASLPEGAPELEVFEGNQGNGGDIKTMLTSSDFHDLIVSGEYHKADTKQRQEWDAMRNKGIKKGV